MPHSTIAGVKFFKQPIRFLLFWLNAVRILIDKLMTCKLEHKKKFSIPYNNYYNIIILYAEDG